MPAVAQANLLALSVDLGGCIVQELSPRNAGVPREPVSKNLENMEVSSQPGPDIKAYHRHRDEVDRVIGVPKTLYIKSDPSPDGGSDPRSCT
jgi:hypothetical protein